MSLPQTDIATPSAKNALVTALVVAGVFVIFIVIYLISRQTPKSVDDALANSEETRWKFSSEGRAARLSELRGKEQTASSTYGWVDQAAGVVRLPLDRAVELTIQDLNAASAKK